MRFGVNGFFVARSSVSYTPIRQRPRRLLSAAFASAVSGACAWSVMQHGIPALRHDWYFPSQSPALGALIRSFADGWTDFGFGNPQPYPTFYALVPLLLLLQSVFAPPIVLTLIIFSTMYLAADRALSIGRSFQLAPLGAGTLALIIAFNPWVYTEYVAGHIFMVTGYAVLVALVAECVRTQPRPAVLCCIAAYNITQLEFFLIAVIPFVYFCIKSRRYAPVLVCGAFAAPIIFGIIQNYAWIRSTPHGLDWEIWASVPLRYGTLLTGYSRGYAAAFAPLWPASAVLALLALGGLRSARHRAVEATVLALALITLVFASGYADFFAGAYSWLVLHVPEISVFRELYDLIAFVAIGTVIGTACAIQSRPYLRFIAAPAALCLALPWIGSPVAGWTVPAAAIPRCTLPARAQERVVVLPAFQPLSLDGRGSGTDPDAFPSPQQATPLNEWFPRYPVDVALAELLRNGTTVDVRALGGGALITRPYFRTDQFTLANQGIHFASTSTTTPVAETLPNAMPLAALYRAKPRITAQTDNLGENTVFFGDLEPSRIQTLDPSSATHDPQKTWVDARSEFLAAPESGSAFGGVWTTGAHLLPIAHAADVLAHVNGSLYDDTGHLIATTNGRLRWWPLRPQSTGLRCAGSCVIALLGDPPPALLEREGSPSDSEIAPVTRPITEVTPWLVLVDLPPGDYGTLRYNVRFNTHWSAWYGGHTFRHERLATIANGWDIPFAGAARQIVLIEMTAGVQACLECLAFTILAVTLIGARVRVGTKPRHA